MAHMFRQGKWLSIGLEATASMNDVRRCTIQTIKRAIHIQYTLDLRCSSKAKTISSNPPKGIDWVPKVLMKFQALFGGMGSQNERVNRSSAVVCMSLKGFGSFEKQWTIGIHNDLSIGRGSW